MYQYYEKKNDQVVYNVSLHGSDYISGLINKNLTNYDSIVSTYNDIIDASFDNVRKTYRSCGLDRSLIDVPNGAYIQVDRKILEDYSSIHLNDYNVSTQLIRSRASNIAFIRDPGCKIVVNEWVIDINDDIQVRIYLLDENKLELKVYTDGGTIYNKYVLNIIRYFMNLLNTTADDIEVMPDCIIT